MPYDDDDDLYGEEFDFVDDDDDASDDSATDAGAPAKANKRPNSRDKDKADKPPTRGPKRAKPATGGKREPRPEPAAPKPPASPGAPLERAPVGYIVDDEPIDDEPPEAEAAPTQAGGPPADHVVHIYEYGDFKRTIARKFTDEEAVSFAEEYTRTGKAYGRYAVATPEDEEPAPTFEGAAKG